eukprot:TRINITY_DN137_c0_g1_i2.p1 TRINITY_DN137_c0_g1~~TRINITY_DN137_c0_g1_i2.p1  ORF type:complete len:1239 (+),score=471.49 TRINITY_DN137_c0_g1_i2:1957-5673(+)
MAALEGDENLDEELQQLMSEMPPETFATIADDELPNDDEALQQAAADDDDYSYLQSDDENADDDDAEHRYRPPSAASPAPPLEAPASGSRSKAPKRRTPSGAAAAAAGPAAASAAGIDRGDGMVMMAELDDEMCLVAGGTQHLHRRRRRRRQGTGGRRKATAVPEALQRTMGEANMLYVRGDFAACVQLLLEVVRQAPTAAAPYHTLGLLHDERGLEAKSLEFYLIAAHLEPPEAARWLQLARMAARLGLSQQAGYCLDKAVRRDLAAVSPRSAATAARPAARRSEVSSEVGDEPDDSDESDEADRDETAAAAVEEAQEAAGKEAEDSSKAERAAAAIERLWQAADVYSSEPLMQPRKALYLLHRLAGSAYLEPESRLEVVKQLARRHHQLGQTDAAIAVLHNELTASIGRPTAAAACGGSGSAQGIAAEVDLHLVNILLELRMGKAQFQEAVDLVHSLVLRPSPPPPVPPAAAADAGSDSSGGSSAPAAAAADDDARQQQQEVDRMLGTLPVDLAVNYAICQTYVGRTDLAQVHFERLQQTAQHEAGSGGIGSYADLFYNVAQAFVAVGLHARAQPLLAALIGDASSSEYNVPAVWMLLAGCDAAIGDSQSAAAGYQRVLGSQPDDVAAVLQLSALLESSADGDGHAAAAADGDDDGSGRAAMAAAGHGVQAAIEPLDRYLALSEQRHSAGGEPVYDSDYVRVVVRKADLLRRQGRDDEYLELVGPLLFDPALPAQEVGLADDDPHVVGVVHRLAARRMSLLGEGKVAVEWLNGRLHPMASSCHRRPTAAVIVAVSSRRRMPIAICRRLEQRRQLQHGGHVVGLRAEHPLVAGRRRLAVSYRRIAPREQHPDGRHVVLAAARIADQRRQQRLRPCVQANGDERLCDVVEQVGVRADAARACLVLRRLLQPLKVHLSKVGAADVGLADGVVDRQVHRQRAKHPVHFLLLLPGIVVRCCCCWCAAAAARVAAGISSSGRRHGRRRRRSQDERVHEIDRLLELSLAHPQLEQDVDQVQVDLGRNPLGRPTATAGSSSRRAPDRRRQLVVQHSDGRIGLAQLMVPPSKLLDNLEPALGLEIGRAGETVQEVEGFAWLHQRLRRVDVCRLPQTLDGSRCPLRLAAVLGLLACCLLRLFDCRRRRLVAVRLVRLVRVVGLVADLGAHLAAAGSRACSGGSGAGRDGGKVTSDGLVQAVSCLLAQAQPRCHPGQLQPPGCLGRLQVCRDQVELQALGLESALVV